MKISRQFKYPEWKEGMYIPIGGRVIYNNEIIECVIGSGCCSAAGEKERSCHFYGKNSIGKSCVRAHKCTGPYREDRKTVSFKINL